jgi:hypothetical protein
MSNVIGGTSARVAVPCGSSLRGSRPEHEGKREAMSMILSADLVIAVARSWLSIIPVTGLLIAVTDRRSVVSVCK